MDDFTSKIEALEHRWMRAWMGRNRADLKALCARDLIILFGGGHPAILDRASWLEAAESRLRCSGYRFGNVYARKHGKTAVFTAPIELEATYDGEPMERRVFVTSIWVRTAVRRRWQMVERVFSGQVEAPGLATAIRSMQLWR